MNLEIATTLSVTLYMFSSHCEKCARLCVFTALILLIKFYLLTMFFVNEPSRFVNVCVYTL